MPFAAMDHLATRAFCTGIIDAIAAADNMHAEPRGASAEGVLDPAPNGAMRIGSIMMLIIIGALRIGIGAGTEAEKRQKDETCGDATHSTVDLLGKAGPCRPPIRG
jgi:hypothetical protein